MKNVKVRNTSKSLQRTMRERERMVWPSTKIISLPNPVNGVITNFAVKNLGTYVKERN